MNGDNQPVTITPDAKLLRNLEEFAREQGISTEEAVNVILFNTLKPDIDSKPKIVPNDNMPKVRDVGQEKTSSESPKEKPGGLSDTANPHLVAALRIMVQIAIRVVEERHTVEEKTAKGKAAAEEAVKAAKKAIENEKVDGCVNGKGEI